MELILNIHIHIKHGRNSHTIARWPSFVIGGDLFVNNLSPFRDLSGMAERHITHEDLWSGDLNEFPAVIWVAVSELRDSLFFLAPTGAQGLSSHSGSEVRIISESSKSIFKALTEYFRILRICLVLDHFVWVSDSPSNVWRDVRVGKH